MRHEFAMLTGLTLAASAFGAQKPNILLILSDDHGFAEMGAYSDFADADRLQAKRIEELRKIRAATDTKAPIDVALAASRRSTPNIDRIAQEGVRFTSFYAAPTCAPARAALMTARYPQRYGVYSNDDVEEPRGKGLPANADIIVRHFHENGYRTGLVGKWHLGSDVGQHPNDVGFEYYFGFDRAFTEPYGSRILYRNREKVPAEGWVEDQISDEAVGFLREIGEDPRPFFLFVSYSVPRDSTRRPPQQYIDYINSGSDIVDVHFGTIYGMDAGIGRILAELEKKGQMGNTLILFGSDNGKAQGPYHSGYQYTDLDSYLVPVPGNGPLRGCKWTIWDGGVRVPFIARLPGGLKGRSTESLQSIMDVLPTALEYAGIPVEYSRPLDGQSFLKSLMPDHKEEDARMLFWAADTQEPYGDFNQEHADLMRDVQRSRLNPHPVRSGNHPPAFYVRTDRWKLMGWGATTPVLIDIKNDISELEDVSSQHPEVAESLRQAFAKWMSELPDPLVYPLLQFEKLRLAE